MEIEAHLWRFLRTTSENAKSEVFLLSRLLLQPFSFLSFFTNAWFDTCPYTVNSQNILPRPKLVSNFHSLASNCLEFLPMMSNRYSKSSKVRYFRSDIVIWEKKSGVMVKTGRSEHKKFLDNSCFFLQNFMFFSVSCQAILL